MREAPWSGKNHVDEAHRLEMKAKNAWMSPTNTNIASYFSYYEDMKPIFITMFLLGRLPVKFTTEGLRKCEACSWPVIYTVLCATIQAVLSIISMERLIEVDFPTSTNLDKRPQLLSMMIILMMNICIPFTYWPDANSTIMYIQQISSFQEEFMWGISRLSSSSSLSPSAFLENYVSESRSSNRNFIRLMSFVNLPLVSIMLIMLILVLVEIPAYVCIPFVFIFMSIFSSTLWWCTNCYQLARFANVLIDQTAKAVRSCSTDDLRWCRLIWGKMSNLTRELGYCCQYSAVVGNAIMGVSFVLSCYACLAAYYSSRFSMHTIGILIGLPFNTFIIYITFKSAHDLSKKLSLTFSSRLLSLDLSHLSSKQNLEINYLLQSVQLNPPVIRVADFVTLDKSLITSFASNAITYLIVLIQFSGSVNTRFASNTLNTTNIA